MKNKFMIYLFFPVVIAAVAALLASETVHRFSAPYTTTDLNSLPETKTALLLGTSPKLANGKRNLYFDYRISAAAKLYRQGKVRHIIASGDHRKRGYNEPDAMIAALVHQGVPAEKITADYAGLRTLDSVLRARSIFDQEKYIIVSQEFHNERAVYLARAHGMEAYGYNAADVSRYRGLKTQLREYGARLKMFWDLWTNTDARYGGDKILIPDK